MMPHFLSSRDETVQNMSASAYDSVRISALSKALSISSLVDRVTLGPNASLVDEITWCENRENEKNASNTEASKEAPQTPTKTVTMSPRSNLTFSLKKILLENEIQRKEEVRKAMEKHRRQMERSTKEMHQEFVAMQAAMVMKRAQREAEELARIEAEEEFLDQQYEIRRKHEQQLQAQRVQERKEKLKRETEEYYRLKEREELVNRILPLSTYFHEKCRHISNISKGCKDKNSASASLAPLANKLKELNQQMEFITEKARTGDITAEDINIAEDVVRQSDQVLIVLKSEIARIDALYEEEIARREYEMRQAEAQMEAARISEASPVVQQQTLQEQAPQTAESTPLQLVAPLPVTPPNEPNATEPENAAAPTESPTVQTAPEEQDSGNVDYQSLQAYMNTHAFLTNYAATYRDLTQATAMKKFRFECQKAINIPVNAISGINGAHLKDKYETLRSLLMGNSSPNVTQHPQGVAFCKDVLAKKIVSQGETLISSKPEMAFPVAAVAVAIWNEHPDFGEILLAHFSRTCPYILPVFLPRLQGQTNEEYYKSLGYKYTEEGVVEKQDKYLTRMSGLMRLYASIIVTRQRRGVNRPHPHGVQNAWRWIAATLNAEPRPDLSDVLATLMLDMLEVAGNSLWQVYPKQFPKMLSLLQRQYYPLMRNEAGIGGGPMARLEQFLRDCTTNRTIPPPEGELAPNFW